MKKPLKLQSLPEPIKWVVFVFFLLPLYIFLSLGVILRALLEALSDLLIMIFMIPLFVAVHLESGVQVLYFLIRRVILESYFLIKMPTRGKDLRLKLARPPGILLERISEFLYSRKIYDKVFLPIIRDLQTEYFDSIRDRRSYKATWVRFRGYWSFWVTVATHSLVGSLELMLKLWKIAK